MAKYSDKAQKYIGRKIKHLKEKEDVPQKQAVAMAHSYAKEKGYDVPKNNPHGKKKDYFSKLRKKMEKKK